MTEGAVRCFTVIIFDLKENPFDFSGLEQRFSDTFVTEPLLTFVMDADEKKKNPKRQLLAQETRIQTL